MSVAAIPQRLTGSKGGQRTKIVGGIAAVVLVAAVYLAFGPGKSAPGPALASQVYQVVPMDLEIKISKDGEIQAINNIDINCQVEGTSTITTIVKEGIPQLFVRQWKIPRFSFRRHRPTCPMPARWWK